MFPSNLPDQIADISFRIAELERRARNRRRKGTVAEVSDDGSQYRVRISGQDGKPCLTGWIRPRQIAAAGVKIDVLYSKGEQVDVISESGDLADAQIDFSTYSDDNPRENANAAPLHIKIGDTVIQASGAKTEITTPVAVIHSPAVHLGGEGGKPVARIGDLVHVASGSSAGMWPIVEGSATVSAID